MHSVSKRILQPILPRFKDIAGFLFRTSTPPLFRLCFPKKLHSRTMLSLGLRVIIYLVLTSYVCYCYGMATI